MAVTCVVCGEKQGIMAALNVDLASGQYRCPKCLAEIQKLDQADHERKQKLEAERWKRHQEAARAREVNAPRVLEASRRVLVTGTPSVEGYRIVEHLGIESVEFVIGTGIFSEISSSIADFFGTRSSAFEKKLADAKRHAMAALKYAAAEKGANAVVAVDLNFSEFSGNRIALILNGTLVIIEPVK